MRVTYEAAWLELQVFVTWHSQARLGMVACHDSNMTPCKLQDAEQLLSHRRVLSITLSTTVPARV